MSDANALLPKVLSAQIFKDTQVYGTAVKFSPDGYCPLFPQDSHALEANKNYYDDSHSCKIVTQESVARADAYLMCADSQENAEVAINLAAKLLDIDLGGELIERSCVDRNSAFRTADTFSYPSYRVSVTYLTNGQDSDISFVNFNKTH